MNRSKYKGQKSKGKVKAKTINLFNPFNLLNPLNPFNLFNPINPETLKL